MLDGISAKPFGLNCSHSSEFESFEIFRLCLCVVIRLLMCDELGFYLLIGLLETIKLIGSSESLRTSEAAILSYAR